MTELDFLPQWYQVRQDRRRSYFVFIWLGAMMLGCMGFWFYLVHGHVDQCRADLQRLEAERAAVNEELLKIDKLRAVRDDLIRKATIADSLQNQPDAVHLVSRLVELMPEDLSLVQLELTTEVIREAPAASGPGSSGPRGRGRSAKPQPAPPATPVERSRYLLKITGVAPDDTTIAGLIASLSQSKMFDSVQMGFTKDLKRGARLMRQFELSCQVSEAWRYQPANSTLADATDKQE